MDSWLSLTPSPTVNSNLLSGTGVAASGIPGEIVSTLDGLSLTLPATLNLISPTTTYRH